jgi:aryl-alcohol dehydrogenase-like predicted oxidoreductase
LNYRTLGRTGLKVSCLALGTVELGLDYGIRAPGQYGQPQRADAIALVHAALGAGINLIDTAPAYGESESILGEALKNRREQVILATKVRARPPSGELPAGTDLEHNMLASLDASLRALQTDHVDLWQIHDADTSLFAHEARLRDIFDRLRSQGKVRWVGASTYGQEAPAAALDTGLFDFLQVPFSVLDQRLSDTLFHQAAESNVGLLIRSVLLKGAVTERADFLPEHLRPLTARSQQFREILKRAEVGLTPAQAAIAFALSDSRVNSVLIGVRSLQELHENLAAAESSLPAETLKALYGLRIDDETLVDPVLWNLA